MQILRTIFKKEIVAEFLLPRQAQGKRRKTGRNKVIIIASGMPGVPRQRSLLEEFAKKGYWVFYPRYRGSWESRGMFLKTSPEKDVRDVIDSLPRGFKDLWSGKTYRVRPDELYIFAGSFGGPAGILLSKDPRVAKVIAVSPVVDFRVSGPDEPLDKLEKYVTNGFAGGYRFRHKDWVRLGKGKFYNPATELEKVDGRKILIYHAQDDRIVRPKEVTAFAKKTAVKLKLLKKGGHLSMSMLLKPRYWRQVKKFLGSNLKRI